MGAGPVTSAKKRPTWKLKPPHDRNTQGIVVSGFSAPVGGGAVPALRLAGERARQLRQHR